jgi:hypothetical protein
MALTVKRTEVKVANAKQRAAVEEYRRIKRMQEALARQEEAARAELASAFGRGVKFLVDSDGAALADLIPTSSRGSFDRARLKAEHPDIHDRYWTPGEPGKGTPRLVVH